MASNLLVPDEGPDRPEYSCAIIRDRKGDFVLEDRPTTARLAPGRLTCFGGRRQEGESARACLLRELEEELGWRPSTVRRAVQLVVGSSTTAWFYRCYPNRSAGAWADRAGVLVAHVAPEAIGKERISPWHRAVLQGFMAGDAVVRVDGP